MIKRLHKIRVKHSEQCGARGPVCGRSMVPAPRVSRAPQMGCRPPRTRTQPGSPASASLANPGAATTTNHKNKQEQNQGWDRSGFQGGPGTLGSALWPPSHLILTTSLWGLDSHNSHLTDEETEAPRDTTFDASSDSGDL